ncbi:group II intron reverse transcriptase/maturase [Marinococcus halotolerans]|uniref:group II intron reverse transcriptase/maturase n=1 Tax=Marinococcus halotolerans TaxID=301092 RepID=UPI0003B2F44E|nr:group II intron reverse transcriptase/maturase [Marinococcus halotolerans]
MLKKTNLRYHEYYDMQTAYDRLYSASQNGNNFYQLMKMIGAEQNIRLAYRNIKTNKGSKTAGQDGRTIQDIWHLNDREIVQEVRKRLENYQPQPVRRVWIPKEGSNEKRPLGIPTIWDRMVQQSIRQVLEPICEAKFHPHSYGFRPNRSAHHAFSRVVSLANRGKCHYCVDIDIKGFFNHVHHGKLLKQLWQLGIRDKSLMKMISKVLKTEIEGEGVPQEGTPQGGIISPLLANVVLNELDWWVSSQWETYKPHRAVSIGFRAYAKKYTNLKAGFIVRYADDFKIMTKSYRESKRYYHAVVDFLQSRLGLTVNDKKSRVINLKKNASEFLGFKLKLVQQQQSKHGYVVKSSMNDHSLQKTKHLLKRRIKDIQHHPKPENVFRFNQTVRGIQNYYRYATTIYMDLTEVHYTLLQSMRARFRTCATTILFKDTSASFQKRARGISPWKKIYSIQQASLVPVTGVHHKNPRNFSQHVTNYTKEGRKKIHQDLRALPRGALAQVMNHYSKNQSIEYNDNRISKYVAQYGRCFVTGQPIGIDRIHCHHIQPKSRGGSDHYANLVIVDTFIHRLIHLSDTKKIQEYLRYVMLAPKHLKKLNELRQASGLEPIKPS